MKIVAVAASAAAVVLLTGCVSLRFGTEAGPPSFKMEGIVNGYASASALHAYNGTILDFDLLIKSRRPGEFVSLDIWPLAGVGVGVVGARVRVITLEAGLGVLWYDPKPEAARHEKPAKVEGSGRNAGKQKTQGPGPTK